MNYFFIVVPAAILEGLLFSKERSNFLNYGLLGTIIARKFGRSIISYKSDNISQCVVQECDRDAVFAGNSVSLFIVFIQFLSEKNRINRSIISQYHVTL